MGLAVILMALVVLALYLIKKDQIKEGSNELTLIEQKYVEPAVADAQKAEMEVAPELTEKIRTKV